jgi:hypothetical protein
LVLVQVRGVWWSCVLNECKASCGRRKEIPEETLEVLMFSEAEVLQSATLHKFEILGVETWRDFGDF